MSPDPLRRVALAVKRHHAARTERDAAIADAVADGVPLRRIAEAAGLSHVAVLKIARSVTPTP